MEEFKMRMTKKFRNFALVTVISLYILYLAVLMKTDSYEECFDGESLCYYTMVIPAILSMALVVYFFQWLGLMYIENN